MMWLFAILIVLALGGVAVVAAGRTGALPEEYDDRPDVRVPAGRLTGADVRRVRFSLAFRGYRMSEVDTLLTRLADQLDEPTDEDTPEHAVGPVGEPTDEGAAEPADETRDQTSHDGRDLD